MKIGICYPYELEARAGLDLVAACETRGLDSVWVVENPGWPGAFATAGAVAAVTRRMLVSIGVVSAFTRSPATIAVEAGQVQKLSQGRFRLGLGVGSVRVLGDLGIDTNQPVEGIAETVKVLRAIFEGGIEGHQGKRHTVRQFKLAFDVEPPPAIHIGTMGPKMTVLAGRIADGLIVSTHTPIDAMKHSVGAARAACRESGRSPADFHVTAFVIASIRGNTAEARDALRPRQAIDIWRITRNVPSFAQTLSAIGLDERKIAAIKNAARPQDIIGLIDDAVLDALCFAGDAAAFERRLFDLQAAGIDEVVLFQAAEEHDFKNHLDDLVSAARKVGALKRSGNHAR
jgi:alkanesulfonate monooxygenase SsuD/methylene tetrahydromethanopterin reductase-like flavin-dependent oxidoreductase (luciferase family)